MIARTLWVCITDHSKCIGALSGHPRGKTSPVFSSSTARSDAGRRSMWLKGLSLEGHAVVGTVSYPSCRVKTRTSSTGGVSDYDKFEGPVSALLPYLLHSTALICGRSVRRSAKGMGCGVNAECPRKDKNITFGDGMAIDISLTKTWVQNMQDTQ